MTLRMKSTQENKIIIYQPDETLKLDVQVEDDTVWLTQAQMVELFQTTKQNISLHTNNIFKEGELNANSVVKEYLTTASDGKISLQLCQDVERHNRQYPGVTLHAYNKAHDRFLIIDEDVYHIGHSLKDLGKKLFAFSKMDVMTGSELLSKL